jgi:hypothetical protein
MENITQDSKCFLIQSTRDLGSGPRRTERKSKPLWTFDMNVVRWNVGSIVLPSNDIPFHIREVPFKPFKRFVTFSHRISSKSPSSTSLILFVCFFVR